MTSHANAGLRGGTPRPGQNRACSFASGDSGRSRASVISPARSRTSAVPNAPASTGASARAACEENVVSQSESSDTEESRRSRGTALRAMSIRSAASRIEALEELGPGGAVEQHISWPAEDVAFNVEGNEDNVKRDVLGRRCGVRPSTNISKLAEGAIGKIATESGRHIWRCIHCTDVKDAKSYACANQMRLKHLKSRHAKEYAKYREQKEKRLYMDTKKKGKAFTWVCPLCPAGLYGDPGSDLNCQRRTRHAKSHPKAKKAKFKVAKDEEWRARQGEKVR